VEWSESIFVWTRRLTPTTCSTGALTILMGVEPAACILPHQAIEEQAKAKEDAELKAAFESGQIVDLNTLTVKQLQRLAKQNGWQGHSQFCARRRNSLPARTFQRAVTLLSCHRFARAARTELLDELEPGVDHSGLKGKALIAAKKKHHIGPLKNRRPWAGGPDRTGARRARSAVCWMPLLEGEQPSANGCRNPSLHPSICRGQPRTQCLLAR